MREPVCVRQVGLLSAVGVYCLRGVFFSTRGPKRTNLWCTSCIARCTAG